jgi:hypothetical protein
MEAKRIQNNNNKMANSSGIQDLYEIIIYNRFGDEMHSYTISNYEKAIGSLKEDLKLAEIGSRVDISQNGDVIYSETKKDENKYTNGGGIQNKYKGKTKEEIWNSWTKEQRIHFIKDHDTKSVLNAEEQANFDYDDVHDSNISDWLGEHIYFGQYNNGGGIDNEKRKQQIIDRRIEINNYLNSKYGRRRGKNKDEKKEIEDLRKEYNDLSDEYHSLSKYADGGGVGEDKLFEVIVFYENNKAKEDNFGIKSAQFWRKKYKVNAKNEDDAKQETYKKFLSEKANKNKIAKNLIAFELKSKNASEGIAVNESEGGVDSIEIEIKPQYYDEKDNRKNVALKYDVNYLITFDNKDFIELTGTLKPYHTGRDYEYEFEPSWFADDTESNYYEENREKIEQEILDKFYSMTFANDGGVGESIKSYKYGFDTFIEIVGTNYGGKIVLGRGTLGGDKIITYLSHIKWDDNNIPDNADDIEEYVDENLDNLLQNAQKYNNGGGVDKIKIGDKVKYNGYEYYVEGMLDDKTYILSNHKKFGHNKEYRTIDEIEKYANGGGIDMKAAEGFFLDNEFEMIVAKLKDYLSKYPYIWTKGNKRYVPIEGWQYAAALMGLSSRIVSVSEKENGKWQAEAQVVNKNGVVVCSGFSILNKEEHKWAKKDEDLANFIQTRAVSRALRNCLSYLIKAAGYSTTPSEEMYGLAIEEKKKKGMPSPIKPVKGVEDDFIFDRPEYNEGMEQTISQKEEVPITKYVPREEIPQEDMLRKVWAESKANGIIIRSSEFMNEIELALTDETIGIESQIKSLLMESYNWFTENGIILRSKIFMKKFKDSL